MTEAVALGGWVIAAVAVTAAAIARCALVGRLEAVAWACHELSGPLTAARLGLVPGAQRGRLSRARLRAIDLELARATLALEDLSEALQGSGAPAGARECPRAPDAEHVDVEELLSDSVEAWRASAASRGMELRMLWSGGRALVIGQRLRLAQATGNLIANALEHGGGPVEVRGRAEDSGVRIEVLDCGPGLVAPVAELVRSRRSARPRWSRLSASRARGRGLAIADAVAVAHGGRLASAPSERGAKLVLELPAAGHAQISAPAGG
jgi:signal transduction histidine kinase